MKVKELVMDGSLVINGKNIKGLESELYSLHFFVDKRYSKECAELAVLASKQLNLEKNVKKGNFEDLCDLKQIIEFLESEVDEIKEELLDDADSCYNSECECGGGYVQYKVRKRIDYQRAREEIGDVAACLVGLLAKLDKMEGEKK